MYRRGSSRHGRTVSRSAPPTTPEKACSSSCARDPKPARLSSSASTCTRTNHTSRRMATASSSAGRSARRMARTISAQHCCSSCRTARRRTGSGTRSRLPGTAGIRGMRGSRGGCLGIDPRCRPTRDAQHGRSGKLARTHNSTFRYDRPGSPSRHPGRGHGHCRHHPLDAMRKEIPEGVLEMLTIPGLPRASAEERPVRTLRSISEPSGASAIR